MRLEEARDLAAALVASMTPFCERVRVAGSIRRGKPEVKDVEIVAVPKWKPGTVTDLFGEAPLLNMALAWAYDAEACGDVRWIKPGTSEIIPWEPKRDGKYWRGLLKNGAKLDLFLAEPGNFGLIQLIRTGSADFSQAVVTHAKRIGLPCRDGYLWRGEERIDTPDEADVFRVLRLAPVTPEARTDGSALRRAA